ncbi:hypothetical protein CHS0354_018054 [Potamilus streckersoni]|uniref:Uncharacterized protein n=1 Tax=Potamilus streckersoni TaxID=2493646 RepID=A0AAE0RY07_9BIVA|nr:hypothetical protein CHS0354_018054 [Potamilus streckersoni]
MDRLRLPRLQAKLLCQVIAVLLFRTTFAESSQSIAQTVTESVIPVSSLHVSAGTSKDLDLFSGNQLFQILTQTRNTTHMPITSTSHELSPMHTSALLSTLLSVDTSTKMAPLYAPSSPFLKSVDMQSSSHTIVNVYTDTVPTSNVRTSTESQSDMTTVSSREMNSSITSGFVPEFQDRNTSIGIMPTVTRAESFASYSVRQESEMVKTSLRFPPESGQAHVNIDSSTVSHNLATDSYRTQSQNIIASDITEITEFTRQKVLHPSIISLLASSLTNNILVPTETSSSPSPSSSTSFSSLATTTLPYDLAIGNMSATSNTYRNELNSMLDSHADMSVSSISTTEVITEAKTNPHLHVSLVRNDLLLDANAVISTSQSQTRSTSSSNKVHDMTPSSSVYTRSPSNESHDMAPSSSEYTRSPKLFSPATSLQPSPTVSAENKYTTTITVNLPPIQEKNNGQHLIKGISSPLTHTQSRQSNETIILSSTIIYGSNDSSSLSSIPLDRSHPYINQTLSITPKSKVLPTSAEPALSSSLAEFALTTVGITSQSSLMSADKRATDGTASSVQQVDRFPHPTHEEIINQPCTNVDKTTSVELESTSTDSLFKSLKYDLRFAITFQGDCGVMTDDSKLQQVFWESIISLICGTLNLPENTVQPEDIICPPLRVYFNLKQITRIDAFEVLNYTISNNLFQVPIIADSVPVIYRGQSIQRLELTSNRPDRSVTTLERLDIIIISIAAVLFFVLLVACSCICCREMYRRKHVQSFKLKETPHVSVKVEDYTLTRIPRTKVIYTDSHMLTEEDLGVNHQQIESRSKENGDHHLIESSSTNDVDRYQNESESTVNEDHQQNESGSKVNSDHHLDESKVKVTGDCHQQNESGSKVNEDPVEGRENEINQDSIMIKVRSHADGIVIGVTCSPSQIPKVTKPLSDCLAPTENNLSGGSSDSLIEKTEGDNGLSNPNCLADDERYAGHTSPEEDEELL